MHAKTLAALMLTAAVLAGPARAWAATPAESFAQGETLLAKGAFTAALQSFAAAARAEKDNPEYVQHYAMLRRVLDMRSRLEAEQDPKQWEYMAKALRAFYASEHVFPELLRIDQTIHARLGSADSAAGLAETQLAMGRHADAAETLASLEPQKTTAMTRALLGIAMLRSGKTDEAKRIAGGLNLPADASPGMTYAAARLYAGTGDPAKALTLLKTCLEGTRPSALDGFKGHARQCPEFVAVASGPEFERVLETKSKVPESKCSGGSSCAGCPMSGKCPHSQGKAE